MKNQVPMFPVNEFSEHSTYFADFYRLFHRISMMNGGQSGKVVAVTSATAGEGKSTVASFLMVTAALSSHNYYLLVDGDLHRPTVHEKFGCSRVEGLSEILMGEREVDQVICKTGFRGLHIITAGRAVTNPFQIFSIDKIKETLQKLRSYYDIIIIDGPPLVPVSNALKLAQVADGTILVVKAGQTPREVASHAVKILQDAKLPLWGVILNDTGEVLPYYYQPKYHYNQYYQTAEPKR
jgi:receptor protein-tyrosine kinase